MGPGVGVEEHETPNPTLEMCNSTIRSIYTSTVKTVYTIPSFQNLWFDICIQTTGLYTDSTNEISNSDSINL